MTVTSPPAPSVITILLELDPLLVLSSKSVAPPVVTVKVPAPFEVRVAAAPESPTFTVSPARTTSPVPAGVILISMFESVPLVETEERVGPLPVAALAILNSLTAEPVVPQTKFSFPLASAT